MDEMDDVALLLERIADEIESTRNLREYEEMSPEQAFGDAMYAVAAAIRLALRERSKRS